MAVRPHLYQLFYERPSDTQTSKRALVAAFWQRLFPGRNFGQNHTLDQIFVNMSHCPILATLPLGHYYFDLVAQRLPTRDQVKHRESCNLRLHCFDSWVDLKRERKRAAERRGGRSVATRLGELCQRQMPHANRSMSTAEYIFLMYGHRC